MHLKLYRFRSSLKKKKAVSDKGCFFKVIRLFSLTSLWGGKIHRNLNEDKKLDFFGSKIHFCKLEMGTNLTLIS